MDRWKIEKDRCIQINNRKRYVVCSRYVDRWKIKLLFGNMKITCTNFGKIKMMEN